MPNIRNFCIIAHIDHGKSTLADRFLELTGTVRPDKMKEQYLDRMDLERERGITIKMTPVRMNYRGYHLNLIDTPGHVDFYYEVSRSLAAVEGAILLVDVTQGIQAQTLSNFQTAKKQGLFIIPALNKIDLPESQSRIEEIEKEVKDLLNNQSIKVSRISAKTGQGVEELLNRIVDEFPAPSISHNQSFQALVFDSFYDYYRGIIAYVRVFSGEIKSGDQIFMIAAKQKSQVVEVGCFTPELSPRKSLTAGEIGYIATGLKDISQCRVGETITVLEDRSKDILVSPRPGYQEPKPMIFAGLYLENKKNDFEELRTALQKLKLNDASLYFEPESSTLGYGFKCGFLGMLHLEIVIERLKREFNLNLIITPPNVSYLVKMKRGTEKIIYSASQLPDSSEIKEIREPFCQLEIISPSEYLGNILKLMGQTTGIQKKMEYLGTQRMVLIYQIPLREVIIDFYDRLKSATSGYASMNYEFLDYYSSDLVKIDVLIAGQKVESLAQIVPRRDVYHRASKIAQRLKELIPPQLFAVPIQAAIGGKIIARETIKARRKDVTAPLYGGDYTRKRKLLEKQKKGKKKMKELGKIKIPADVFLKVSRWK